MELVDRARVGRPRTDGVDEEEVPPRAGDVVEQGEAGAGRVDHFHVAPRRLGQAIRRRAPERVVGQQIVPQTEDADRRRHQAALPSRWIEPSVSRRSVVTTSPVCSRTRTSSGMLPGRLCVAQPWHGSYARKAISTMLRSPSEISWPDSSPLAAFSTLIAIRAELFWVATMRFALRITPRSSVS